jgi:putative GTP pyrophosphokinase
MDQSNISDDFAGLLSDYEGTKGKADRLATEVAHQLETVLANAGVALAVPVQYRVKGWESIRGKVERQGLSIRTISELTDLVGLRVILLFRRDLQKVREAVERTLKVIESDDKVEGLGQDRFGYASIHLLAQIPAGWVNVPTLSDLDGLVIEIQIRTVAQHAWAAASHLLQYKQEISVPPSVLRSINRVAALLETVDLEFERVLFERDRYRELPLEAKSDELLNTDLLGRLLAVLSPDRKVSTEPALEELLADLLHFEVDTPPKLKKLVAKHGRSASPSLNQVGVARFSLRSEFGYDEVERYIIERRAAARSKQKLPAEPTGTKQ